MDFFSAMKISSTGLSVQRTRMNVTSSNLANIETTRTEEGGAYRRRSPVVAAVPLPHLEEIFGIRFMNKPTVRKLYQSNRTQRPVV